MTYEAYKSKSFMMSVLFSCGHLAHLCVNSSPIIRECTKYVCNVLDVYVLTCMSGKL